jgi:hypothetical protein
MAKATGKVVSIDWCEDTLKRNLPGDEEQFIEVRRFTAKQRRKRQQLAGRIHFKEGEEKALDDISVEVNVQELKTFEYTNGIVDFKLLDSQGKFHSFDHSHPDRNLKIYDHITGDLEVFIDELLGEVNKDTETEEVKEIEGNSGG